MTEPEVLTPESAERQAEEMAVVESAAGQLVRSEVAVLVIETDAEYQSANDRGRDIAKKLREAETERKRLKEPALESGRRIDKFFSDLVAPWQAALDAIKKAMSVFERKKEEERRRIEEQLRQKALAEQRRLENLALANAARAEAADHTEKAEAILENLPTVPVPTVAPLTPEVKGSYGTKRWKARLATHSNGKALTPDDAMKMLAKAVAEGQATPNLIVLNEVIANKLAAALGKELRIPGIEAYQVESKVFK